MKYIFLLLPLSVVLFSCGNATVEPEVVPEVIIDEPVVEVEVLPELNLSILPLEHRDALGKKCQGVEASFYYSSKSMSSKDCLSFLNMLEANPPTKLSKKEMGHVSFIVDGDFYTTGKIVMENDINYLVFSVNDSSYYHNLTQSGIDFFNGMVKD